MDNQVQSGETKNPRESGNRGGFKSAMQWAFKLRSVALSLPVAVIAVILAVNNMATIPGELAIGAGDSVTVISKSVLVMGPLALTALAILMTLFSKRVVFPWLISIFTLLLPVVLAITMTF